MQLFDNAFSPYAFKVRATLYEKGVKFEKREIKRKRQREDLLLLNPKGEVPALRDGDTVVCDSRVICDYIEERFPSVPLLPSDPARRAKVRRIEMLSDTQLDAAIFVLGTVKMFAKHTENIPENWEAPLRKALGTLYLNLEKDLNGQDHFDENFSRADIALTPHIAAAEFMGMGPEEEHPELRRWLMRVSDRPSIQQATQELMDAFRESNELEDSIFDKDHIHWRNDRLEWGLRAGLGPWILSELDAGRAFIAPVR